MILDLHLKMSVSSRDTFDKTLVFAVYDYDRYISVYIPLSDYS